VRSDGNADAPRNRMKRQGNFRGIRRRCRGYAPWRICNGRFVFGGAAAAELAKQQTVALVAGMASAMERACSEQKRKFGAS
jgi:hypothetical protein